jgi:hypothetical protein
MPMSVAASSIRMLNLLRTIVRSSSMLYPGTLTRAGGSAAGKAGATGGVGGPVLVSIPGAPARNDMHEAAAVMKKN